MKINSWAFEVIVFFSWKTTTTTSIYVPVLGIFGSKSLTLSSHFPMGLSPQLNRVVITQFVRFLYLVRLSMTRFRVNGEIVPLGAFSWSDKSPRRVKSRLTLTWTCSRNFIVQFPNVIEKPVFWFGIGLQGKKKAISLTQQVEIWSGILHARAHQ